MLKKAMAAVLAASMSLTVGIVTPNLSDTASAASNTRYMEALDRGLVAMKTDSGIYLSWRLLGTEAYSTSFYVYKNNSVIATVSDSTNYLDTSGTVSDTYSVAPTSGSKCTGVKAFASGDNFIDIPLAPLDDYIAPDGTAYEYEVRDGSVGDLDGDGEYELVVKREANRQHAGAAGFNHMYMEAYKLDGTVLWRIDMGQNMRAMTEFSFLVYDFNNDGVAEIACKTAPGTKDGTGQYVTAVSQNSSIKSADNTADYHDSNGYILTGPEYYTLFDGRNGEALDTINYPIPRGTNSANDLNKIWGDNYGHRAEKCMSAVAYLDGVNPNIVLWRGIYFGKSGYGAGRTALAGISVNSSNRLVLGNQFDTWSGQTGYTSGNEQYIGQGNHNLTVGDVDGDGYDEILSGGLCIDHTISKALWCSYRGHGDALHLGNYDPTNNSLEYFTVQEEAGTAYDGTVLDYGMTVYDAKDGTQKLHIGDDGDTGRGVMANLGTGGYYQVWGSDFYQCNGNSSFTQSTVQPSTYNFRIFWDGDLYDELWDATNPAKTYTPNIFDYNSSTGAIESIFVSDETRTINGTKATPIVQADIFGDWREEFVVPTADEQAMRVYTTNILTTNKLYTLMHDSMYREAVAWQNQYYKQPPHIGFYVSDSYDKYDERAVQPNIKTVTYSGSAPSATATPVKSGVKTRNSKYLIDEDGDYYTAQRNIIGGSGVSGKEGSDVWSFSGYTYGYMTAASKNYSALWKCTDAVENNDGKFLLFAANGKTSTFTAKNDIEGISSTGVFSFDFAVPETYSNNGYTARGNANSYIYLGDGTDSDITFGFIPTVSNSYVTALDFTINGETVHTFTSGADAQSWTHVECALDHDNKTATIVATYADGTKSTTNTTWTDEDEICAVKVNVGTTWGALMLDAIKLYETDGVLQEFWSEDFESSSNKFSLITSGYSANEFLTSDPSTTNAMSGTVYGVGSRSGGDTGTQSSQIGGSNYKDITVDLDFKMDACMSGKGSAISLLGSANKLNYLSNSSQILTISAKASGNGYWSNIAINGTDITSAANVSNGTSNGESSGAAYTSSGVTFNAVNRDTTGWIHLTAKPDFDAQTIDVTLTRVSTGATIYSGTLSFVNSASSLEYIYMASGKYYGGTWLDNISITGYGSSSSSSDSTGGSTDNSTAVTGTNKTWNMADSSFVNLGTLSSTVTADDLTINATSSKTVNVSTSGGYTLNGTTYSTMLALGGGGNTNYRSVKFDVTGPCTIKVIGKSSGSSTRTLAVSDGSSVLGTMSETSSLTENSYSYTGNGGTIYLYSQGSGINIYQISVEY